MPDLCALTTNLMPEGQACVHHGPLPSAVPGVPLFHPLKSPMSGLGESWGSSAYLHSQSDLVPAVLVSAQLPLVAPHTPPWVPRASLLAQSPCRCLHPLRRPVWISFPFPRVHVASSFFLSNCCLCGLKEKAECSI